MTETKKSYTVEEIRERITTDQRWCEKAIMAIYARQTSQEQELEETKENNGVGFTGYDAHTLTYYAKYIQSGRHLSGRFLEDAFKKIAKYAKQLHKIAEGRI